MSQRGRHRKFKHPDGRVFVSSLGHSGDVDPATVRDVEILESGGDTRTGNDARK